MAKMSATRRARQDFCKGVLKGLVCNSAQSLGFSSFQSFLICLISQVLWVESPRLLPEYSSSRAIPPCVAMPSISLTIPLCFQALFGLKINAFYEDNHKQMSSVLFYFPQIFINMNQKRLTTDHYITFVNTYNIRLCN